MPHRPRAHGLPSLLWWVAGALRAAVPQLEEARELHQAGRLEEALTTYGAVAEAAGTPAADAAAARNNACVILTDLSRYPEAVLECREAMRLRRSEGDDRRLARTLNNLGRALDLTGDRDGAGAAYHEALGINRRLGDAEGEAANLTNLAVLALALGDYDRAIDHQRRADALAAAHAAEPWAAEVRVSNRINEGAVLEKLGAARAALARYRQLADGEPGLDARRRAALLTNTAVLYRNLGDPVRAEEDLVRATAFYAEVGDQAGLSNVHLNLGLVRRHNLRDAAGAERAFREALRLARASGDRGEEVQDLYHLGEALRLTGKLAEAEATLLACLELAGAIGAVEAQWSALEALGRLERQRGELPEALSRLEGALAVIEGVRSELAPEVRAGFFGDKRAAYAATLEVLADLDAAASDPALAERALAVALGAKARDLLDAIGGERTAPLPPLAALRASLGGDALIEFFVGEERLFVWTLTRGGLHWRDLGSPGPVLAAAARVHRALAAGSVPNGADLAGLGATLLAGPLADGAAGRRWWIGADRGLFYLPFELLPSADGEPLLATAEVTYLPSGAVLAAGWGFSAASPRFGYGFVGLGDPRLSFSTPALGILGDRFALDDLTAAATELEMAAERMSEPRFVGLGEAASEAALVRLGRSGARVVHLAAHTLLDELSTRGPAVLLAAGEGEDGLVTPAEIAARPYAAALTVLAGCQGSWPRCGTSATRRPRSSWTSSTTSWAAGGGRPRRCAGPSSACARAPPGAHRTCGAATCSSGRPDRSWPGGAGRGSSPPGGPPPGGPRQRSWPSPSGAVAPPRAEGGATRSRSGPSRARAADSAPRGRATKWPDGRSAP